MPARDGRSSLANVAHSWVLRIQRRPLTSRNWCTCVREATDGADRESDAANKAILSTNERTFRTFNNARLVRISGNLHEQ